MAIKLRLSIRLLFQFYTYIPTINIHRYYTKVQGANRWKIRAPANKPYSMIVH